MEGLVQIRGEFDGLSLEGMRVRWEQLRDEVLGIDAQLGSRNRRDDATGKRMPDFEYHRWRQRAVQQKTDCMLQMSQLKRLIRELEEITPRPESNWWRGRAADLREALDAIYEASEVDSEVMSLAGDARDRDDAAHEQRAREVQG